MLGGEIWEAQNVRGLSCAVPGDGACRAVVGPRLPDGLGFRAVLLLLFFIILMAFVGFQGLGFSVVYSFKVFGSFRASGSRF